MPGKHLRVRPSALTVSRRMTLSASGNNLQNVTKCHWMSHLRNEFDNLEQARGVRTPAGGTCERHAMGGVRSRVSSFGYGSCML